jgi:hypothetical protein
MFKSPKQQVTLIGFSTLLAAFSLGSIITFTDPFTASWITFIFFYLSLFLAALGIFTLLGLGLRQILKQKVYVINLSNSFRQAFLISLLIIVSFLLLSQQLLFWWVELSLVLFLLFAEIFFNLKI